MNRKQVLIIRALEEFVNVLKTEVNPDMDLITEVQTLMDEESGQNNKFLCPHCKGMFPVRSGKRVKKVDGLFNSYILTCRKKSCAKE